MSLPASLDQFVADAASTLAAVIKGQEQISAWLIKIDVVNEAWSQGRRRDGIQVLEKGARGVFVRHG